MGTLTSIGGYDPRSSGGSYVYPGHNTSPTLVFDYDYSTPSVFFDDWSTAVDFARRIASAVGHVTVRKFGAQWSVSWVSTTYPATYPSAPSYPWTYPYITYSQRSDTA